MLNFLSFLVLLYVSGHFKQKIFFSKFFRLIEKFHCQSILINGSRGFVRGFFVHVPWCLYQSAAGAQCVVQGAAGAQCGVQECVTSVRGPGVHRPYP